MDRFVIPGKGVYSRIMLSTPAQDEDINIGRSLQHFRFEQRLPGEDGNQSDIIVLVASKLMPEVWGDGEMYRAFYTAFEGDLPSERRLTFLPASNERESWDLEHDSDF